MIQPQLAAWLADNGVRFYSNWTTHLALPLPSDTTSASLAIVSKGKIHGYVDAYNRPKNDNEQALWTITVAQQSVLENQEASLIYAYNQASKPDAVCFRIPVTIYRETYCKVTLLSRGVNTISYGDTVEYEVLAHPTAVLIGALVQGISANTDEASAVTMPNHNKIKLDNYGRALVKLPVPPRANASFCLPMISGVVPFIGKGQKVSQEAQMLIYKTATIPV